MTSILLKAALVADGITATSKTDHAVLVADDHIAAVGFVDELERNLPPETTVIDLGKCCLAPGLIDSHTHLSLAGDSRPYRDMFAESDEMMVLTGAMNLRRHLDAGITTLREHGARNRVGFMLKEGVHRGYIPGPRMQVSGRPITCCGGHFHMCNEIADGVDELRRSVRRLVHEGADFIKIMASGGGTDGTIPSRATYETEELDAAVQQAHHFDRLTAAHCRASESMLRAVEAGVDLIEHAEFLDTDNRMRFDPALAEMMAESGIWISPTLQAWTGYPGMVALERVRNSGSASPKEEQQLASLEQRAEKRLDIMRRLLEYIPKERIVPGSDSGVGNLAFGHLDYDLQLLHRAGFTPSEALASATRVSASAIGMEDEIGTIEAGKIADLVAFDGDPNEDVSAFSRVVTVFQSGCQLPPCAVPSGCGEDQT